MVLGKLTHTPLEITPPLVPLVGVAVGLLLGIGGSPVQLCTFIDWTALSNPLGSPGLRLNCDKSGLLLFVVPETPVKFFPKYITRVHPVPSWIELTLLAYPSEDR